jgi:hypothetical protein
MLAVGLSAGWLLIAMQTIIISRHHCFERRINSRQPLPLHNPDIFPLPKKHTTRKNFDHLLFSTISLDAVNYPSNNCRPRVSDTVVRDSQRRQYLDAAKVATIAGARDPGTIKSQFSHYTVTYTFDNIIRTPEQPQRG